MTTSQPDATASPPNPALAAFNAFYAVPEICALLDLLEIEGRETVLRDLLAIAFSTGYINGSANLGVDLIKAQQR